MFLHHEAESISKWLDSWNIEPITVTPPVMLLVAFFAAYYDPRAIPAVFAALVATSPLWLPIALFVMFWKRWIHYIRFRFWFSQPRVTLHIELPREVEKSPLAMELVLTGMWINTGETTFVNRIVKGSFAAVHSLELVSNGGRIGFYMNIRASWRDFIEARIYGQYPEARITVVDDYVSEVDYSPEKYDLWGTEYSKKDVGAMPIKTYIDWQLDKNPDTPEIQVEPLTNIFELLSSINPDERLWIQILIKRRKGDWWYGFPKAGDKFMDEAVARIKKITKEAIERAQSMLADPAAKERAAERGPAQLTEGERQWIFSIERSMSKHVFDCGVRALYICPKGKFELLRVNNLVTLWDPFRTSSQGLGVTRGQAIFNYPWQDWRDIRRNMIRKRQFFWYKHRAYFYVPYDQDPVLLTTEEVASMWHFPSSVVKTPGLVRVGSSVSEAPPNLPSAPANLPTGPAPQ